MFRHFVTFVLYVLAFVFMLTILFPFFPWYSIPNYPLVMIHLHSVAYISPFYSSYSPAGSYSIITARDIAGILSFITALLLFHALGKRNRAFRTGDKFVLSSMRYEFGVTIFMLLLITVLFYSTIPAAVIQNGNYNEAVLIGFMIFFMLWGAAQSPSYRLINYAAGVSNTPLKPSPNPGNQNAQTAGAPMASVSDYKITGNEDRESVGILGPVASGKSTMLAYFIHFLKDTTKDLNVNYEVLAGQEFYREFLDDLLKNRRFPSATGVESPNRMLIRFFTQKGVRKKSTYLEMNDVAGELFSRASSNPQRRREAFHYLSSCSAYLFIIDCSIYKEWTIEDVRFASILDDLYRAVGEKKIIKSPIAFIFTKSDLLPDAVQDRSPGELLSSLRNTMSYVESHFKDYSAFKTYIQTERNGSGDLVPKLDTLPGARVDIIYDPQTNYGFQQITEWICRNGDLI
ncbi:MAG: GTPase domain-containing protein [Thermoplasmataceae archaeon]